MTMVVVDAQESNTCNLRCHEAAPCEMGDADFSNHSTYDDGTALSFHSSSNINGMHCSCPHGWTGITCNRVYNSCDGDHKCYNGGACIPGLTDYYGNEQLFCDCSHAMDEDGIPFVGKFCESASEMDCGSEGLYCANGGECNPNYPHDGVKPCFCINDFDGPHCEFKASENVPTCTLTCQNGGNCQLGYTTTSKEFHDIDHLYQNSDDTTDPINPDTITGMSGTAEDHMMCVCPPGFGGKLCDVPMDACGSHQCYHGGTCIDRTAGDGTKKYHCDCSSAETDDSAYAGRFCQYKSTAFCTKTNNQNGQLFCVNSGQCSGEGVDGCICPEDYYGPSCEFKKLPETVTTDPNDNNSIGNPAHIPPVVTHDDMGQHLDKLDTCTLPCENQGKCRTGQKDLGVIAHIAPHIGELNQTSDNNFQHCVCRAGYVGLQCEHKLESCPGGEHVCLHGSKCVTFGDEQRCDCSAQNVHSLSGDSCQHKNTAMCTEGELQPAQPRSFCVNGGTCTAMVSGTQKHVPCSCSDEWVGPHCELHKATVEHTNLSEVPPQVGNAPNEPMPIMNEGSSNNTNNNDGATTAVLVIGLVALVASVFVSAGTYVGNRNHRRRLDQEHKLTVALATHGGGIGGSMDDDNNSINSRSLELSPVTTANMAAGEPEVYLGPPRDEDGHELHCVEII
eukprot:CAMPEP_0119014572 /NCGR_PEP_ID=MMETSP1176-20130426/9979_1 /TAXON_ID=265551 /ORGANISM="Synedropsis recta cf, Strain CCMP1620" /LENGTH=673 /DNA_ID=CAMNT_0006967775 /DNA_START=195 /DNA_END=2216 /DNA_ORIENTATION=-